MNTGIKRKKNRKVNIIPRHNLYFSSTEIDKIIDKIIIIVYTLAVGIGMDDVEEEHVKKKKRIAQ